MRSVIAFSGGMAVFLAAGCESSEPYQCRAHDECVLDGVTGWCEGSGDCSFPDLACPSGRRFGEFSAGGRSNQCVDLDPSLVAWYSMDDAVSGGVARDTTGAHDGSCAICPEPVQGWRGGGYRFDGMETFIVIPDHPAFRSRAGTVALWAFQGGGTAAEGVMVSKLMDANDWSSWALSALARQLRFYGGGAEIIESPAGSFPQGRWVHCAAVWDGGDKRLYIDGAQAGLAEAGEINYDASDLLIGMRPDPAPSNRVGFAGVLDDVRIYQRALAPDEIEQLAAP